MLDARAAGVVAAASSPTWRKAPIVVVIVIGAGVTAVVRAVLSVDDRRSVGLLDEPLQRPQVALPDPAQHPLPPIVTGDRAAEVPREAQVLAST